MCPVIQSYLTLLSPHRLQPTRLLSQWDSPGKNTGVGCHFLLQGICPTQGSNLCLLHWQAYFITEPARKTLKSSWEWKNLQLLILGSREKVMGFVWIFSFNPVLQIIHPYFIDKKTKGKLRGFAGGPVVKNPSANAGDIGSIPSPGRSHMCHSYWGLLQTEKAPSSEDSVKSKINL